jgi:hypothetical protein
VLTIKKPWSISTTVRNPERLRDFLRILKKFEGKNFTKEIQVKYQIFLIQEKIYKPNNIPQKFQSYYQDPTSKIPDEIAKEIFEYQKYTDPSMRGRQSVNPLNKLGFAIAREGYGPIKITELGNLFLNEESDIGLIFFKSLLKLQFPNPWSKHFSENNGFNIKPFIATLKLMDTLKKDKNYKGLTRTEFCLFIPTLINIKQLEEQIKKIRLYKKARGNGKKDQFIKSFIKEFYEVEEISPKKIKNLFDYGDNIMRYFRFSKYFKIETNPLGYEWTIDLEPSRMAEIEQLINKYDGAASRFEKVSEYLNYMADFNRPELPWEKIDNLRNIIYDLRNLISQTLIKEEGSLLKRERNILEKDISSLSKNSLNKLVLELRELIRKINIEKKKRELKGNKSKINEIIGILEDQKKIKKLQPETFEKILSETLKILNDEILIKPNYLMDDEAEPIYHAPGNKPDIECYYDTFKAIFEVTLNTSNTQWMQEGQPIARHLRDFEKKNGFDENIYCIFVAPRIREDTYSILLYFIEKGYDGKPQKIIPLTTSQITTLLKKLLIYLEKGKRFTHKELFNLYEHVIIETKKLNAKFSKWDEIINNTLELWEKEKI